MKTMKVLLHINEAEKWQMTLANAKNMLNYSKGSNIDIIIEILTNGIAVTHLTEQASIDLGIYGCLEELSKQKVDIVACRNALKSNNINESDLCPFIRTVPAGIVELVIKQNEGYAYIKP